MSDAPITVPQVIPLAQASFCESCQVFCDSLIRCPKCDSPNHLMPMSQRMGKEREDGPVDERGLFGVG